MNTSNEIPIPVWQATWSLIKFRPRYLLVNVVGRAYFVLSRLLPGLVLQRVLDQLTNAAPATVSIMTLLVLLLAVEISRVVGFFVGGWGSALVRNSNQLLLRRNIINNVLNRHAALGIPMSPGEAINRLDDDVADFADFPTWLPELLGHLLFFIIAVGIMARISWQITAVALIPLFFVGFLNRFAWQRFLYYITESRDATSAVTGYLGEIFAAVQVVKVADAQEEVMGYFDTLNQKRLRANVRFVTFWSIFRTAADNAGDIAVALMVLIAGQAIANGNFTIGDFALFSSYLFFAARFPAEVGSYISEWAQQRVSIQRMHSIAPQANGRSLITHHPIYERETPPTVPFVEKTAEHQLERLEVRGLCYAHPTASGANQSGVRESSESNGSDGSGVFDVSFTLERGSFTAVTGRVGSGKSTLLRVLLGLLPMDSGEILWNGRPINNPAQFFVPPRTAYTPQVPRLFSDPLRDNILMGLPEDKVDWQAAVETAVLTPDLATLENGIDTIVGPRGVRLSGGQVQRAAAARMLVRNAELLIFDDISSALDVETERRLWQGLIWKDEGGRRKDEELSIVNRQLSIANHPTCLVVSHRPAVLRQADWVIVMENGRVAAQGRYEDVYEKATD